MSVVMLGNDANTVYMYDIANHLKKLTNNIDDGNSIVFEYADYDHVGNRLSCKIDDNPVVGINSGSVKNLSFFSKGLALQTPKAGNNGIMYIRWGWL